MQKILLVLMASLVSLNATAQIKVVATLPVLGDIAEKVGGKFVSVSTLAQPNQDPHSISPTSVLMKKVKNADVFIENGLSLEIWVPKVVDGSGNTRILDGQPGRVVASLGVVTIEGSANKALGDVHPSGNPHVWLDPENAKIMARNMSEGFSRVDPSHKADYAKGLKQFETDIDTRMIAWKKKAEGFKGLKFVTYHKSFDYFAKRFEFEIFGEIEEFPGVTPSAKHRDALIVRMKHEKIGKIIQELFYELKYAKFIADETGAQVIQVPIDVRADDAAKDYFSLIDLLLNKLTEKKI